MSCFMRACIPSLERWHCRTAELDCSLLLHEHQMTFGGVFRFRYGSPRHQPLHGSRVLTEQLSDSCENSNATVGRGFRHGMAGCHPTRALRDWSPDSAQVNFHAGAVRSTGCLTLLAYPSSQVTSRCSHAQRIVSPIISHILRNDR